MDESREQLNRANNSGGYEEENAYNEDIEDPIMVRGPPRREGLRNSTLQQRVGRSGAIAARDDRHDDLPGPHFEFERMEGARRHLQAVRTEERPSPPPGPAGRNMRQESGGGPDRRGDGTEGDRSMEISTGSEGMNESDVDLFLQQGALEEELRADAEADRLAEEHARAWDEENGRFYDAQRPRSEDNWDEDRVFGPLERDLEAGSLAPGSLALDLDDDRASEQIVGRMREIGVQQGAGRQPRREGAVDEDGRELEPRLPRARSMPLRSPEGRQGSDGGVHLPVVGPNQGYAAQHARMLMDRQRSYFGGMLDRLVQIRPDMEHLVGRIRPREDDVRDEDRRRSWTPRLDTTEGDLPNGAGRLGDSVARGGGPVERGGALGRPAGTQPFPPFYDPYGPNLSRHDDAPTPPLPENDHVQRLLEWDPDLEEFLPPLRRQEAIWAPPPLPPMGPRLTSAAGRMEGIRPRAGSTPNRTVVNPGLSRPERPQRPNPETTVCMVRGAQDRPSADPRDHGRHRDGPPRAPSLGNLRHGRGVEPSPPSHYDDHRRDGRRNPVGEIDWRAQPPPPRPPSVARSLCEPRDQMRRIAEDFWETASHRPDLQQRSLPIGQPLRRQTPRRWDDRGYEMGSGGLQPTRAVRPLTAAERNAAFRPLTREEVEYDRRSRMLEPIYEQPVVSLRGDPPAPPPAATHPVVDATAAIGRGIAEAISSAFRPIQVQQSSGQSNELKEIQIYDGSRDFNWWIFRLNRALLARRINDPHQKLCVLRSKLRDGALRYWDTQEQWQAEAMEDWDYAVAVLVKRFGRPTDVVSGIDRMKACVQTGTLEAFIDKIFEVWVEAITPLKWSDAEKDAILVKYFLEGLNARFRNKLNNGTPGTFAEFTDRARLIEKNEPGSGDVVATEQRSQTYQAAPPRAPPANQGESSQTYQTPQPTSKPSYPAASGSNTVPIGGGQAPPSGYKRVDSRTCYRCGMAGHIGRNCRNSSRPQQPPQPPTAPQAPTEEGDRPTGACPVCKSWDHFARDCPQRNQTAKPSWMPEGSGPWCTYHKTANHDTSQCQKKPQRYEYKPATQTPADKPNPPPVGTSRVEGVLSPPQNFLAQPENAPPGVSNVTMSSVDEDGIQVCSSGRPLVKNQRKETATTPPWHGAEQPSPTQPSPMNVVTMTPSQMGRETVELNRVSEHRPKTYLFVYPRIGQTKVEALIDTGAQSTLMRADVHRAHFRMYELKYVNMDFKGFNDQVTTELTGVMHVSLTIGHRTKTVKIYVVEKLQHPLLLGDDALRTFGLVLDYEQDQVYLEGKSIDCFSTPDDETKVQNPKPDKWRRHTVYNINVRPTVTMCRVTHSLNIPAEKTMFARCRVMGNHIADGDIVEVQPHGGEAEDVDVLSPRLVTTVRNGLVFVPISNLGKNKARVRAGKKLASVEQVEVIQTVLSSQEAHEAMEDLYGDPDEEPKTTSHLDRAKEREEVAAKMVERFKKWLTGRAQEVGRQVEPIPGLEMNTTQLSDDEKWYLAVLLNEYREVFTGSEEPISGTAMVEHVIEMREADQEPIKQPYRNLLHHRAAISEEVEEMLRKKMIQPSNSPWASPVVIVKKKDGSIRFCVDYRGLNAVTKKDSFPLPRIDETLATLTGAVFFTTFDLQSAYSQVPVRPSDREKTAFSCHEGLFEYTVMPFGLSNAPATFQRLMQYVLKGLLMEYCMCYLDDVVIFSKTPWDHMFHLGEVLYRLQRSGLKLKPKKCALAQPSVHFLGHIVSKDGIQPDPEKVTKVRDCEYPKSVKQVRQFLGLTGYYRSYICGYGAIASPLYDLTQACPQNLAFKKRWNQDAANAFDRLKQMLTEAPVLGYPDLNRPFKLYTDASNIGLGYILAQEDAGGSERVIYYGSKKLTDTESRYAVTEKECLAVVRGFIVFRQYLLGGVTAVFTDHLPLIRILDRSRKADDITPRLLRMAMMIAEYEYTIHYKPGRYHLNADGCSRPPIVPGEEDDDDVEPMKAIANKKKLIKMMSVEVKKWRSQGPEGLARVRQLNLMTQLCRRELVQIRTVVPINVATQTRGPKKAAIEGTTNGDDPSTACLDTAIQTMELDGGSETATAGKTATAPEVSDGGPPVLKLRGLVDKKATVKVAAVRKGIPGLEDEADDDEEDRTRLTSEERREAEEFEGWDSDALSEEEPERPPGPFLTDYPQFQPQDGPAADYGETLDFTKERITAEDARRLTAAGAPFVNPCYRDRCDECVDSDEETGPHCEDRYRERAGALKDDLARDCTDMITGKDFSYDSIQAPWSQQELMDAQREDDEWTDLIYYLETNELPEYPRAGDMTWYEGMEPYYTLWDGILFRLRRKKKPTVCDRIELQLVVPEIFRHPLMEAVHETRYGAHIGWRRALPKLQNKYYWPKMAGDLQWFIERCIPCSRHKDSEKRREPLEPIRAMMPFEMVAVDVMGPFLNESNRGNRYVISFMDYYTKWPEAFATPDHTAATVIRLLMEEIIPRHGVPRVIISDQAPEFISEAWTSETASVGAHVCYTSPYHHQANGLVERWNRTLMDMLRPMTELEPKRWDEFLPAALFAYRTTIHASTGNTPAFLTTGRDIELPGENPLYRTAEEVYRTDYAEVMSKKLTAAWKVAAEKNREMQKSYKRFYDRKASKRDFRIGDRVLMMTSAMLSRGRRQEKFHPLFDRLFRVVAVSGANLHLARYGEPDTEAKWYHSNEFKHFMGDDEAYIEYEGKIRARKCIGPHTTKDTEYSCVICDGLWSEDTKSKKQVDWIKCHSCLGWFHTHCIGYDPGDRAWKCPDCTRADRMSE